MGMDVKPDEGEEYLSTLVSFVYRYSLIHLGTYERSNIVWLRSRVSGRSSLHMRVNYQLPDARHMIIGASLIKEAIEAHLLQGGHTAISTLQRETNRKRIKRPMKVFDSSCRLKISLSLMIHLWFMR